MCCRSSETRGARRERKCHRQAFTLVELMVVIVIVGLLAGTVTVGVRSYLIKGKQAVARKEIATICTALDTYYTQYDNYPETDSGLAALVEKSDEFPDGLLNKVPKDPWGSPYNYVNPGRETAYEVVCYGADKQEGGVAADKDISSAELESE